MVIDKSKYMGYLWQSDKKSPEILPSSGQLDTDAVSNPFVVEGQLVDSEKSISIKFVDGKYLVKEYLLVDYADVEPVEYIPNRMEGVKGILFKRAWKPVNDDLCEGWEVLQPAELVFVGLKRYGGAAMAIKAPFNFVPLADKVFFPEWAAQISQDIPFKDGVSGTINLKITAESPIFVRNGHTSKDKEENNETYKSFSKTPDGKYFIPATSIKGAIRNVLEIMSFGKMAQVQNQSFGIRDLSTGSDGRFYREKIKPENIHCGWLKMEDEDHYLLEDCGLPWRISAEALDGKFGVGLKDFIFYGDFSNDENRTAAAKYDLFKGQNLVQTFSPD